MNTNALGFYSVSYNFLKATPSTNPFAAAGPSVASFTNPFQTNARGATGKKCKLQNSKLWERYIPQRHYVKNIRK